MAKKNSVLSTISRLVSFIERLSDEQIRQLDTHQASITFEFVSKDKFPKEIKSKKPQQLTFASLDIDSTIDKLKSLENRHDVDEYLNNVYPTRQHLEAVARKLDIPYSKKDKTEHLRNKIIEGTIGYKLRSQAIQTSGNTQQ